MARDGNSLYSRIVGNGLHDCEGKHLLWKMLKSNPKKASNLEKFPLFGKFGKFEGAKIGKGFSRMDLEFAGIERRHARKLGIRVDIKNKKLTKNAVRLKEYFKVVSGQHLTEDSWTKLDLSPKEKLEQEDELRERLRTARNEHYLRTRNANMSTLIDNTQDEVDMTPAVVAA